MNFGYLTTRMKASEILLHRINYWAILKIGLFIAVLLIPHVLSCNNVYQLDSLRNFVF